jgi:hypothetical protein
MILPMRGDEWSEVKRGHEASWELERTWSMYSIKNRP